MPGVWSPENIVKLKQMWSVEGQTAGYIAKQLDVTRNAVIGKAKRLGYVQNSLAKDQREAGKLRAREPEPKQKPGPKPKHEPRDGRRAGPFAPRPLAQIEPIEPLPPAARPGEPITLMQLRDTSCRWPVEGGLYCGCTAMTGKPYCSEHTRRATGG